MPGCWKTSDLLIAGEWQLSRAQAMMGDQAAARKSYQDFLNL